MLGASLYIIVCSARNRLRMRLRRLREPRYLAGAVVGAAYLYFSFFGRLRGARSDRARAARARRRASPLGEVPGLAAAAPVLGGMALLAAAALSWMAPFESGLLEFSEAETQFLLTAPITRRQLLLHRLLRSQIGMLFGAVIFGITVPSSSGYRRLSVGIATWLLLVTWKIYFAGVSLTKARMRAESGAPRAAAFVPAAIVVSAAALVAAALLRAFYIAPPAGLAGAAALVAGAAEQPVIRIVLWPFIALVRPLFAASTSGYVPAIAAALAVTAAVTVWMLRSDDAFHLAVDAAARRRSRRAPGRRPVSYRTRAEGWTLAPSGRPETAFAWKALMQTLRVFDRREAVRAVVVLTALTLITVATGREGPAALLGGFSMAAAGFAILMAPQVVRIDMRQDLEHLELLKTWPVRAASVVRGQLLWPTALITAFAWTMIAIAVALSGTLVPNVAWLSRVAAGVAVLILAPALVVAQLTVHNAVALMFPAWVPLGVQRARGVDAMGQRIILLGGTWLLLIVMAIPAALAGGLFWLAAARFFGTLMLMPAAAIAAVVIAIEVVAVTEALGPVYDRLDILAVERPE